MRIGRSILQRFFYMIFQSWFRVSAWACECRFVDSLSRLHVSFPLVFLYSIFFLFISFLQLYSTGKTGHKRKNRRISTVNLAKVEWNSMVAVVFESTEIKVSRYMRSKTLGNPSLQFALPCPPTFSFAN